LKYVFEYFKIIRILLLKYILSTKNKTGDKYIHGTQKIFLNSSETYTESQFKYNTFITYVYNDRIDEFDRICFN